MNPPTEAPSPEATSPEVSSEIQSLEAPADQSTNTPQGKPLPAYRWWPAIAMFLGVTAGILIADMALKYWAFNNVAGVAVFDVHESATDPYFWHRYPHDPTPVVPYILSFRLTTNTGAVFGLGKGNRWFFVLASFVAIMVIGYLFARSDARATWLQLALAMVLAGALGNLYDRWFYGAVRDMLWLFPETNWWPWIFNLADVSLVGGVGLILVLTIGHEWRQRNAGSTPG